eukprot:1732725-Prymnesium_polylepis.1
MSVSTVVFHPQLQCSGQAGQLPVEAGTPGRTYRSESQTLHCPAPALLDVNGGQERQESAVCE